MKASDSSQAQQNYEEKTEALKTNLQKTSSEGGQGFGLYKETSNLFRPKTPPQQRIDVRSFTKIIEVDPINLTATVEGMTSYEELVKETLKFSCLPTVVPELKSITIGGALAGCGIESSSFRYGLVHETIQEIDVLLSNGSLITCNGTNTHSDLFFGLPNTYGTLGYALKVKVQLIVAKKFIKLTHQHFTDIDTYFETLQTLCHENKLSGTIDYIDGVFFGKNNLTITTATFTDNTPYTSDYTFRNIYYRSIQDKQEDYLTTEDYIWRWDADWFWCSKVFGMQHPLMRLLCGKWMLSSTVYTKIMRYFHRHPSLSGALNLFQQKKESIIQDVLIPIQHAKTFLEFFQKEIGISPVWICPASTYSKNVSYPFCPIDPNTLYLDFGFWDSIPSTKEEGYYNKKIEEKARELNGFKSLYSSSYYREEEFWKLYDKKNYQLLKNRYDPQALLKDLFTKCCLP